jgi:hypothetical protein
MPGTLARHLDIASTVRGFMLVWPRAGEPIIVLDAFAEKLARRESWIKRVEVYQAYAESLYTKVAAVIADLGLGAARVGFEQDYLVDARQSLPTAQAGMSAAGPLDGKVNLKVAPASELLLADIRPPWASMIERLIARPIPIPLDLVVKKELNSLSTFSNATPVPESVTATRTWSTSCRDRIRRSRGRSATAAIASMPFITRLMTTCCNWIRSPSTGVNTGDSSRRSDTP